MEGEASGYSTCDEVGLDDTTAGLEEGHAEEVGGAVGGEEVPGCGDLQEDVDGGGDSSDVERVSEEGGSAI